MHWFCCAKTISSSLVKQYPNYNFTFSLGLISPEKVSFLENFVPGKKASPNSALEYSFSSVVLALLIFNINFLSVQLNTQCLLTFYPGHICILFLLT